MEQESREYLEQIPQVDWEKTPFQCEATGGDDATANESKWKTGVAEVLTVQEQQVEKLKRTSKNSSSPPSQDPPGVGNKQRKPKSSKKRGGQPGHEGHRRELYPVEECSEVVEHHPSNCRSCGEELSGEDANPRDEFWDNTDSPQLGDLSVPVEKLVVKGCPCYPEKLSPQTQWLKPW